MKSFGRTLAALVVAAGLFGYIYFVESKKDPSTGGASDGSTSTRKEKVFARFDKMKVKSLTLKKRGGDIVQAEKNGDGWTLVSPKETPADPAEIGMLLDALQTLETEEVVNESAPGGVLPNV